MIVMTSRVNSVTRMPATVRPRFQSSAAAGAWGSSMAGRSGRYASRALVPPAVSTELDITSLSEFGLSDFSRTVSRALWGGRRDEELGVEHQDGGENGEQRHRDPDPDVER